MSKVLFILGTVLYLLTPALNSCVKSVSIARIDLRLIPFNGHYRVPVNGVEELIEKDFFPSKIIEDTQLIHQIKSEIEIVAKPENRIPETLSNLRIYGVIQYTNGQSAIFLCTKDSKVVLGKQSYKKGEKLVSIIRRIFGDTDNIYKGLPSSN